MDTTKQKCKTLHHLTLLFSVLHSALTESTMQRQTSGASTGPKRRLSIETGAISALTEPTQLATFLKDDPEMVGRGGYCKVRQVFSGFGAPKIP